MEIPVQTKNKTEKDSVRSRRCTYSFSPSIDWSGRVEEGRGPTDRPWKGGDGEVWTPTFPGYPHKPLDPPTVRGRWFHPAKTGIQPRVLTEVGSVTGLGNSLGSDPSHPTRTERPLPTVVPRTRRRVRGGPQLSLPTPVPSWVCPFSTPRTTQSNREGTRRDTDVYVWTPGRPCP